MISKKPTDPVELLKEIEAYLSFRLCTETPTVPPDDMRGIKSSVNQCLCVEHEPTRRTDAR